MDRLAKQLRRGSTAALSEIIRLYTPYVCAIASNIAGHALPQEDIEEIAADSFIALWNTRERVEDGKIRPYLSAIVRSKAKGRLRSLHIQEPFSDECLNIIVPAPEDDYIQNELSELTRRAVDSMGEPDGEIFRRHYFLYQKTEDIAAEMGMQPSTVRARLSRGRAKLRKILSEMGVRLEDINN